MFRFFSGRTGMAVRVSARSLVKAAGSTAATVATVTATTVASTIVSDGIGILYSTVSKHVENKIKSHGHSNDDKSAASITMTMTH